MEQEHHGKLMFIVLGLIAVIVIVLGLIAVFGKKGDSPSPESPVVQNAKTFDEATAATDNSLFSDSEIQAFENATAASQGASGGMSQSEIDALNRATSAI